MAADHVSLTVPARGEYARTVRMTASALATRMDMTFDDVDDVRMAAEESFVYACDFAAESSDITLDFSLDVDELQIRVRLADGSRIADEDGERGAAYATFILQSVCDTFEMSSDEEGPYLRVVKCVGGEPEDAER